MNKVYDPKSLSSTNELKSLEHILKCTGGNIAAECGENNRKCAEISVGGICPFNGIHTLCQRCRCNESRPDSTR